MLCMLCILCFVKLYDELTFNNLYKIDCSLRLITELYR